MSFCDSYSMLHVIRASRQQFCCMPPADFDVAAVHFVEGLLEELQKQGLQLALANPSHQVRGWQRTGELGRERR